MTNEKTDLKPYRTALEALISHHRPAKLSQMLGNAAANLEDPKLREILKKYIKALPTKGYGSADPFCISEDFRFSNSAANTIQYIEQVIDAGDLSWEVLAETYGWTPPEE